MTINANMNAISALRKRRCVLSCIFNNYEKIHEIQQKSQDVDYVMITDNPSMQSNTWIVIHESVCQELAKLSDPVSKATYVKYHPFQFCPNANTVFKLDGSIAIYKSLDKLFDDFETSNKDVGISLHPFRNDVYSEINVWKVSRQNRANLLQQEAFFAINKFKSAGLVESGYLLFKHSDFSLKLCDLTWKLCMYCSPDKTDASPVDQTLLAYATQLTFENGSRFMIYNRHLIDSTSYMQLMQHNSNTPCLPYNTQKPAECMIFGVRMPIYYLE